METIIMDKKLVIANVLLLLLGLLGGLLVSASDLTTYDYIDRSLPSFLGRKAKFYKKFIDLVEEKGSEKPEETAKLLDHVEQSLRNSMRQTPVEDEFHWYQKGRKEYPGQPTIIMREIYSIVVNLVSITGELDSDHCNKAILDNYLDTVESAFGSDFEAFANGQPAHDTKLHAFLLHYGKKLAQFCLHLRPLELEPSNASRSMDKLVALGETIECDGELSRKAREFDLMTTKLPVIKILKAIVKDYSVPIVGRIMKRERILEEARTQLHEEIRETCHGIRLEYGRLLNLYNFGRLLAPHEAAKLSPSTGFEKLNEYHRICSPIYNPYKATGNEHPSSIEEVRATLYANMYW